MFENAARNIQNFHHLIMALFMSIYLLLLQIAALLFQLHKPSFS